jgi:hypothetical protein
MTEINPSTHRPFKPREQNAATSTSTPADHAALLAAMGKALDAVRTTLQPEDLPPGYSSPRGYLAHVQRIRLHPEPIAGFYDLDFVGGSLRFGGALLDTVMRLPGPDLERFVQLLFLHEVVHIDQGLYSSTHRGIGHASVVLEEMDYAADAISIAALVAWRARTMSAEGASVREHAALVMTTVMRALEAFDRVDQGDRLTELSEARLRRYLIWNLQRVRLSAVDRIEHVHQVLLPRLAVEIEPMKGQLDEAHEKIVEAPQDGANFFVSLAGNLVRLGTEPGFDLPGIVEDVRCFRWDALAGTLRYVVDARHELLTPWV